MASKTARTELKRKRRDAGQNRKRKNNLKNHGTTKSAKALFGDK